VSLTVKRLTKVRRCSTSSQNGTGKDRDSRSSLKEKKKTKRKWSKLSAAAGADAEVTPLKEAEFIVSEKRKKKTRGGLGEEKLDKKGTE